MANGKDDGKPTDNLDQHTRFLETARALGCDEDEAAFDEKLKAIAKTPTKLDQSRAAKDKCDE